MDDSNSRALLIVLHVPFTFIVLNTPCVEWMCTTLYCASCCCQNGKKDCGASGNPKSCRERNVVSLSARTFFGRPVRRNFFEGMEVVCTTHDPGMGGTWDLGRPRLLWAIRLYSARNEEAIVPSMEVARRNRIFTPSDLPNVRYCRLYLHKVDILIQYRRNSENAAFVPMLSLPMVRSATTIIGIQ